MSRIRNFRELHVWTDAFELGMNVFEMSKAFPTDERYSLTDQIHRSSRSVAANIAEAWAKRRYKAAFISKLNDAEAEASESQCWILFAYKCKYITRAQATAIGKSYDKIVGQLVNMMNHPEQWKV